jgi:hypothetical protein
MVRRASTMRTASCPRSRLERGPPGNHGRRRPASVIGGGVEVVTVGLPPLARAARLSSGSCRRCSNQPRSASPSSLWASLRSPRCSPTRPKTGKLAPSVNAGGRQRVNVERSSAPAEGSSCAGAAFPAAHLRVRPAAISRGGRIQPLQLERPHGRRPGDRRCLTCLVL